MRQTLCHTGYIMNRTVEIKKDGVYLSGERFFLLSGDFHYFRTLPDGWKRRLELMKDFGLTAVTTYVPWNLHEPKKNEFNFSGIADLPLFLKMADEQGLKVILRCSPYMCAEWEMGGFPSWLLKDRTIALRTRDEKYMDAVASYSRVLIEKVKPYLYTNGGPVILVGVENEYGSFGNDKEYLRELSALYRQCGIDVPFISANGSDPFKYFNGTLEENWNGIDLGAAPEGLHELERLKSYQPDKPLMISEAWVGGIQFWGKSFSINNNIGKHVEFFRQALQINVVVNFYMFCGGTNFGFFSGAEAVNKNHSYMPLMTSYDYDAPISEEGTPREKYFALRDVLDEYLEKPPRAHIAPEHEVQTIEAVRLTEFAGLLDNHAALAERTLTAGKPLCMEDVDQDYGFIRYTTFIDYTDDRPRHLKLEGLADIAYVFVDGTFRGFYMRDQKNEDIVFTVGKNGSELSILVENMGRVNYGFKIYDRKGLDMVRVEIGLPDGGYLYNFAASTNFTIETMPLTTLEKLSYSAVKPKDQPVFCKGEFKAKPGVDTFIDMRGFNKGIVFVNGFNLGRYWHIGPQQTLYVPGELLREDNVVEILEMHYENHDTVNFIDHSILDSMSVEDHSADGFELK